MYFSRDSKTSTLKLCYLRLYIVKRIKAKIRSWPKWAGPAFLTMFVVGCLCTATWLFFAALDHFLGEENTFGSITISPYGYDRSKLQSQHWDSLVVEGPDFCITLRDFGFRASLSDSVFLRVNAGDANIDLAPTPKPVDTTTATGPITIPEIPNVSVFLKLDLNVDHVAVNVKDVGSWQAKDISLRNSDRKTLHVKADSISGTNLSKSLNVQAKASWNEENLAVEATTIAGKDTVAIAAEAPRKSAINAEVKTQIQIANPEDFIKDYPSAAPSLRNVTINATVSNDSVKSIRYDATIEADLGERYPLPPSHAIIKATGDTSSANFQVQLKTKTGGIISLQGSGTKDLNGEVTGYVKNLKNRFGPEIMPMDMTIHSARKLGDIIYAKATTGDGSHVEAEITLAPKFEIHYTGDLSPTESWATQWSGENLKFASRPQVLGEFSDGEMRAWVRIGKIKYVYLMAADSLQTHLILNTNGIRFDAGTIFGRHEIFDFTGEVMWDDVEPHTSWEVKASDGGNARARVIFEGPRIIADADGVLLSTIPFAKRHIPEWVDARVTGVYNHDFDIDTAFAQVAAIADVQMFHTEGEFEVRKMQDTVVLKNAEVRHEENKINLEASIVLPNDNTERGALPVEILNAWVSTRSFSIPLSLLPLGDSTLTAGEFSGDLSFTDSHGFHGNIEFDNIAFRNISPDIFSIRQMNFFAERAKAELDAYFEVDRGTWDGHTQVTFDQILGNRKHFSFAYITNTGGNVLGDGFIDSTLSSTIKIEGNWLLPGGAGEIKRSDLVISLDWNLSRGLNGLEASFYADSIVYSPLAINYELPIKLEGNIENKVFNVVNAVTRNIIEDSITVSLSYALDELRLLQLHAHTDMYSVNMGDHWAALKSADAILSEKEDEITINANIPEILYRMKSETFGRIDARAHGDLNYRIPKKKDLDTRQSNLLEGSLLVDKLIYKKNIDIEITPKTVTQLLGSLQNTLSGLRRKNETNSTKELSKTNSTNLNIHVADAQQDSVMINASFANFPFTINFDVQGTASRPTLRGELANAGEGFVGFKGLYEFGLQSFLVSWAGVPWQQGNLDISISQDLPYCTTDSENRQNETCPVNIDVSGTITNPQATPSSYCGTESSTASIYYNIFLGCVTEETTGDNVDWNKIAGTAIGKVISSTANKTLGGNYIGNIDMKMRIFTNTETLEEDSSYVKIPISLDKWVNNLSIILGYTQDQSIDPVYDQAFEFGINYKLPFFQEKEYSHQEHLNPELSLAAMLVSKQYHVNSATQENENQLEKNIGVIYNYKFWSPCIFGIGKCKEYKQEPETDSTKTSNTEKAK